MRSSPQIVRHWKKLAKYLQEKEVASREEMLSWIGSDTKQPRKKPA